MRRDAPKPFLRHLEELRKGLIRSLAAVFLFFLISNLAVDPILSYLSRVVGVPFVFVHPTEAFFMRLKIAFVTGFFLSIPYMIYEIWKFVGVALTVRERRWMLGFLPISYFLFCLGAALSWFVVLPAAMTFLMGFSSASIQPFLSIDAFIGFATWMTLAFGILFQLPLVVLFLDRIGVMDIRTISQYRPHVVAGLAVLSALMTPGPDPFSQLALLIPSYVLFEGSIVVGRFLKRSKTTSEREKQWNPE